MIPNTFPAAGNLIEIQHPESCAEDMTPWYKTTVLSPGEQLSKAWPRCNDTAFFPADNSTLLAVFLAAEVLYGDQVFLRILHPDYGDIICTIRASELRYKTVDANSHPT